MNSGVFMKSLDIFCIHVILNLWIGGHSQQTIYNWIANNEWSGAGFPKLRLPGPCEQVFGFSRSLCSCGSFLLPCSHGFRQSFSRSRKGESMCQLTHRKKQSDGYTLPEQEPRPFSMYYELYFLGGFMEETRCLNRCLWRFRKTFGTETLSFCRCCTVRITECSQMNKWYSQTCKCVLQVIFDTRNVEIPVKTRTLCEGRTPCI